MKGLAPSRLRTGGILTLSHRMTQAWWAAAEIKICKSLDAPRTWGRERTLLWASGVCSLLRYVQVDASESKPVLGRDRFLAIVPGRAATSILLGLSLIHI